MRAVVAISLCALAPAVAYADARADSPHADGGARSDVPAKARELAERGMAYHAAGDYDAAVAAFTEAYALAPAPALLFDLAQAYRLGGHCDDAVIMYRRFLSSTPGGDARAVAEGHLTAMERCSTSLAATTGGGGQELPAASVHAAAVAPASARAPLYRDLGIGAIGGGAIALGVATLYGVRAHDASDAVSTAYQHGGSWGAIRATDARGQRDADIATASAITGVVAIGAGVALYYLSAHHERAVAVVPRAGGAEVHAAWRW
jgi:tetratricopeptide (TPR) repeat protein|nr:tetratricopeptide repeat protein [Kofleriaceae bacterium]